MAFSVSYYILMKNTHLEHPEDAILYNRETFDKMLQFLRDRSSTATVKWDGAPAIVFGTNEGKWFVGTKSVFNKVKVKINYSHNDIEVNHGDSPKVAAILHTCFECLRKTPGIWQGDFIGYGGTSSFTPNTLTYNFDETIDRGVVVAVHTHYQGTDLKTMCADFNAQWDRYERGSNARYLNTDAHFTARSRRIDYLINFASVVANLVRFPDEARGKQLKIAVNKCIREGTDIANAGMGPTMTLLYKTIMEIKRLMMKGITSDENVRVQFEEEDCDHEGYVVTNNHGTYKLVNRREFSYRNFTTAKKWLDSGKPIAFNVRN